jgi:hypothetical protein
MIDHEMTTTGDHEYGAMLDPLNAVFGETVFAWWHTGGGCTALVAHLEGDLTVHITDDPSSEYGEEATITPMPTRLELGGDASHGYTVGISTDEGCTPLLDDTCSVAAELPILVTRLLVSSVRERWARQL